MAVSAVNQEFFKMIKKAREEFKLQPDFQSTEWSWIFELDDEGFFIFCYLVDDFNRKVLSKKQLEDTVYTLVMLRHKLVPERVMASRGLSFELQFQILFSLYEKLKIDEVSWDDCESFINQQLASLDPGPSN